MISKQFWKAVLGVSMDAPSDEHERIAALKALVDGTADKIRGGELDIDEANKLVEETRMKAEELIPEDMDKFDMIYGARFRRLMEQFISAKHSSE
jgi:hypothetical protein